MDRVFVKNLCLVGSHGVIAEERKLSQRFYLDIDCFLDVTEAAQGDAYTKTVCYDAVSKIAEAISNDGPFNLIETLAVRIADELLVTFDALQEVRVEVRKPHAPVAASLDHVGCEVRRKRAG